jgi:hypothetical protein
MFIWILLKDNSKESIEKILNLKKYGSEETKFISFLISLTRLNENTVCEIKKTYRDQIKNSKPAIINEKAYIVTEKEMDDFANLNHIDKVKIKNMIRLTNEFPAKTSTILFPLGFAPGREMGIAAERLEKEFFKNPDKIKSIIDSGNAEEIKKIIFINKS